MSKSIQALFLTITLCLITNISCKKEESKVSEIQIHWQYADSTHTESVDKVKEKTFIPLEDSKNHSLASLLKEEKGYLWLKGSFSSPSNQEPVSINFGKIIWAEDIFINGQFLGSTLKERDYQWNFWNLSRVFHLPENLLNESENTILIKIFVNAEGSVSNFIEIGNRDEIEKHNFKAMFYESYINGVIGFLFFVIAFYHLLIYLKRKKDKENFYYAVFCFSYSIYSLNFISFIIEYFFPLPYFYFQKLIFSFMFIMLYSFYRFISVFLKRNDRKWIFYSFIIFTSIPILLTLFSPDYFFMYKIRSITMLFVLPFILYIVVIPVYNFIKYKNPEAKAMLISLFILCIVAFHDIINVVLKLEQPFWAGLGIPTFMASIMFLLGSKFVEVHNETDELNETLEFKVVERTKEVMEKMEVIKTLNIQQDGDYYLTSLIERPLGTNYNKSKIVKTDFFIEQKKKFQFKTKTSELGGDICISGNLRFGDGKDRYVFFFNGDAMGKSMQGAGGAIVAGTVINSILSRSAKDNKILKITPKEWITDTYHEMDSVFKTFDGSMLMSCACGIINEKTLQMWYFNAEHPWTVLLRDQKAEFIESALVLRKLGTILEGNIFQVLEYTFSEGDVLFIGSDGRDDLDISQNGIKDINEDETKFLRAVEISKGNLLELVKEIHDTGKVTDDLSIIRIYFDKPLDSTTSIDSFQEAKDLISTGDTKNGLDKLQTYLNENPFDLNALEFISNYYYTNEIFLESSKYFERILDIFPENLDALYYISICYKKIKEYSLSIKYSERLLALNPKKISNIINLADNYRKLEEYKKSREILNKAIESISHFENAIKLDRFLSGKGF